MPDERKVRADGFAASWQIPHLARSVPQSWVAEGSLDRFGGNIFGVRFYIPLDFYNLVDRALKYGLMFLTTAFAGVFVMEMLSGKRVHGVQYLLVGVAMVFFFVMLLSFAEHIGFALSYLLASGATGGMLSVYVGKALDSLKQGLIMLALFFVIYGFLYMILQLEDYALLAGAIIGFVLLTITMFLTLRIDWSGRGRTQGTVKD